MQIVIDIPEEDYEYLKLHNKDGLYNAILNGKPLPEGHGRLIDVDALEPDTEWDDYYDGFISFSPAQIDNAPTIIEADKENAE